MFRSPIPFMVALNVMGVNLIAPVLPAYAAHFGVGFAAVSTLVAAFALTRMTFRLTAGTLADRHGSRLVCTGGGIVQAGGALLAAVSPGLGILLAARGIQGIGSALFGTSVNRYLLVTTEKGDLGRATAGFQTGILAGGTVGPLIGGVVADRLGIFAPFYVQAIVAAALAVVSYTYIKDTGRRGAAQPHHERRQGSVRTLLGIPGFKVVMLLGFSYFIVRAGVVNLLVPAFADEVLTMSATQIGAIISLGSLVSLFVMPVAGHLADTIGRVPVGLAGAATSAATVILYGVFDSTTGIVLVSALLGIGIGLTAVALPTMIGDIAPPGTEGRASGTYRMANDVGWIVGPTLLGLLADSGRYSLAFTLAAVPMMIGGLVLLRSDALKRLNTRSAQGP